MIKATHMLSLLFLCLTSCVGVNLLDTEPQLPVPAPDEEPEIVVMVTRSSSLTKAQLITKLKQIASPQGNLLVEDLANQEISCLVYQYSYALHPDGRILVDIGYYTNPDQKSGSDSVYEIGTPLGDTIRRPIKNRLWDG